jgi:hypothetical protein
MISVRAPPEWEDDVLHKYDARIVVLDTLHHTAEECKSLIEVHVEPQHSQAVVEAIASSPGVMGADLEVVDEGLVRGTITTRRCFTCCDDQRPDAFLVDVHMEPDGRILHQLIATSNEAVREVVSLMEARGDHVELERLRSISSDNPLTPHQESVLLAALERGYFDEPKGVQLRDLAAEFHVSVSTFSEVLRKAQRKLMEEYFGEVA